MSITQVAEPASTTELDRLAINTIHTRPIDAVEQANPDIPEHPWHGQDCRTACERTV
jgi:hypothetical protein